MAVESTGEAAQTDANAATGSRTDQFDTLKSDVDVGMDERMRSTSVSLDFDKQIDKSRLQGYSEAQVIRNAEQTLLHQAKLNALEIEMKQAEHNQRLRHADFQVGVLAAISKEMVETIADEFVAAVKQKLVA